MEETVVVANSHPGRASKTPNFNFVSFAAAATMNRARALFSWWPTRKSLESRVMAAAAAAPKDAKAHLPFPDEQKARSKLPKVQEMTRSCWHSTVGRRHAHATKNVCCHQQQVLWKHTDEFKQGSAQTTRYRKRQVRQRIARVAMKRLFHDQTVALIGETLSCFFHFCTTPLS